MNKEKINTLKLAAFSILAIVLSFVFFPFVINSHTVIIITIIALILLLTIGTGITRLFVIVFGTATILISVREAQLIRQGHLDEYQNNLGLNDRLDINDIFQTNYFITNKNGWLVVNQETQESDWINNNSPIQINTEGFRSREFDTMLCPDKKRILFLGDSFTFGTNDNNCLSSYVDILDGKYCAFNTGIPSTDLPQYQSVAEKLIPRIKPDFVCLMFCEENDFIGFKREISSDKPVVYVTNFGAFTAYFFQCSCNRHLSFHEAISCYFEQGNPLKRKRWIEKYCSMTRIWSDIYLQIKDLVTYSPECSLMSDLRVTNEYLKRIQSLSTQHGADFLLFIIPDKKRLITDSEKFESEYPGIFDSLEFYIPDVTLSDYLEGNNIHFNNRGNQKMAQLIGQIIKEREMIRNAIE